MTLDLTVFHALTCLELDINDPEEDLPDYEIAPARLNDQNNFIRTIAIEIYAFVPTAKVTAAFHSLDAVLAAQPMSSLRKFEV